MIERPGFLYLPEGGNTGQHLVKLSDQDFDTGWGDSLGKQATIELRSNGDVTDVTTFTPNNSGIKQLDVNGVEMLRIFTFGNYDSDGSMYIGDLLPGGFSPSVSQDDLAIGIGAMQNYVGAFANTAIGLAALRALTTGNENTALGANAGQSIQDGQNNVIIGRAADSLTPGESNNVIVGGQTDIDSGSNVVAIGANMEVSGNNTAWVGDANITDFHAGQNNQAIIHGKGDAIVFPESDPHVAGAAYWVAGVLTKSTG